MPYIDGLRVSNDEWTERYGSSQKFHTGPDGDNPADAPDINEDTGAPEPKPAKKGAGGQRSPKSAKATKAAIADALGVKEDSDELADIDVSDLDAPAESKEDSEE